MRYTFFRRFLHSTQGSAMPLIALGVFALAGATGAAIDMSRVQMVQAKLSNSLDAAGLAVGSEISTTNVQAEALKYFNVNYPPGFMYTTTQNFSAVATNNNQVINLSVQAVVPTVFMQLFGIKQITVNAMSQITRQSSGMELVLVLDNTGSMNSPVNPGDSSTPKIQALQSAAKTLLGILYGNNATVQNLWVGIVPFSQTVNIGTSHSAWMDGTYDATLDFGPVINGACPSYSGTAGTYNSAPSCAYKLAGAAVPFFGINSVPTNWQGCVMARTAPYDTSDDPPSVTPFQAYDYPYTSDAGNTYDPWVTKSSRTSHGVTTTTTTYNYAYSSSLGQYQGPNMFCPQQLQPMVAEQSTIVNELNAMKAGGSTEIDLGMAWAWRMLSPRWRGLWGGEMNTNSLPLNYNTPLMNKVVILMTDGMNELDPSNYTAYKYLDSNVLGTTNFAAANTELDKRTKSICDSMKANGVLIYTIGFGSNGNANYNDPTSVNGPLLQYCASQPSYYFLAPTNAQLQSAFQQIGDSLANLRISQ